MAFRRVLRRQLLLCHGQRYYACARRKLFESDKALQSVLACRECSLFINEGRARSLIIG